MSYILDALRRADAERERGRGNVPGIHAQQLPPGAPRDTRAPASRKLMWVSIGLAVLLLASLAWQWLAHDASTPTTTDPSRAAQGTVTPPVALAPPPPIAPPPVESGAAPAAMSATVAVSPPPSAASAAPVPQARPAAPPRGTPAPAPAARKPPATELATARTDGTRAKSPPPAGAAAAAPRVMSRNELPEDVQRGLPTLTVGGASYSQNPESRMLIVNGQIYREGDQIAPNVSLEQIRLKEAVIATKGYRYRIDY